MSDLFVFLHGFSGRWIVFDAFVIVFARYFQYIVIGYAGILMYRILMENKSYINIRLRIEKALSQMVWVSSSVIVGFIFSYLIKVGFAIPRPFLDGINSLFIYGGYNSFPSGHATIFAALTVSMFFFHKSRGWWFLLSAIAIGTARVVAGVHYPIDIAAGYIVGVVSACLVCLVIRPYMNKYFHFFE